MNRTWKIPKSIKTPHEFPEHQPDIPHTENLCENCNEKLREFGYQNMICLSCGLLSEHQTFVDCSITNPTYTKGNMKIFHDEIQYDRVLSLHHLMLKQWYQVGENEINVPRHLLLNVARRYDLIYKVDEKFIIRRGGSLNAILVRLLYEECIINKTPRKLSTLESIFNVEKHHMTKSQRNLSKIRTNQQIVKLSEEDYITMYLDGLELDNKYVPFLKKFSGALATNKIIHDDNSFRLSTRVAGCIQVLITKLDLKPNHITDIAQISNGTMKRFLKFFAEIRKIPKYNKKFEKLFKKYEIPYC